MGWCRRTYAAVVTQLGNGTGKNRAASQWEKRVCRGRMGGWGHLGTLNEVWEGQLDLEYGAGQ